MKKIIALLLVVLPGTALTSPYAYSITGDMLVRMHEGPAEQRGELLKGDAYVEREKARGYIAGVMDMTHGSSWCAVGNMPPHEVSADVVDVIARLKPKDLEGGAAPLVAGALRKLFPCSTGRRK